MSQKLKCKCADMVVLYPCNSCLNVNTTKHFSEIIMSCSDCCNVPTL